MRHVPVLGVVRQVERQHCEAAERRPPRLQPRAEHLVDLLLDPLRAELVRLGQRRAVGLAEQRVGRAVALVAVLPRQGLALFGLQAVSACACHSM